MMDNWGGYGLTYGNPGGGLFSFILAIIILAAIAVGVIALLRHMSPTAVSSAKSGVSALELLNQRYAKGEINKDEYQAIKKDIA